VNASSDVVRVALPDVGVSVDVDSKAIKYNQMLQCPVMRFFSDLFHRPITISVPVCLFVCMSVRLHVQKTQSSCNYEIFRS